MTWGGGRNAGWLRKAIIVATAAVAVQYRASAIGQSAPPATVPEASAPVANSPASDESPMLIATWPPTPATEVSSPEPAEATAPMTPAASATPEGTASPVPPATKASPAPTSESTSTPAVEATPEITAGETPAPTPTPRAGTKPAHKKKTIERHGGASTPEPSPGSASDTTTQSSMFSGFRSSKEPIDIQSDKLSLDQKSKPPSVLFSGHVRASQAGAELTSKSLMVFYSDPNMREIDHMVARGDVRVSQGTRWATGDDGVMYQKTQTIVLTGHPVVHDGEDQITGDRIIGHLDTGKFDVDGHVKVVIFPRRSQNTDNGGADHSP